MLIKKKKKVTLPEYLYIGIAKDIFEQNELEYPIILSSVYAPYFAYFSALAISSNDAAILRIKVSDLDLDALLPFHGFVERAYRKPIETYTSIVNNRIKALKDIELYKISWKDSFKNCGTVLYKNPISKDKIDKVAFFGTTDYTYEIEESVGPWETLQKVYNLEFPQNEKFLNSFFETEKWNKIEEI